MKRGNADIFGKRLQVLRNAHKETAEKFQKEAEPTGQRRTKALPVFDPNTWCFIEYKHSATMPGLPIGSIDCIRGSTPGDIYARDIEKFLIGNILNQWINTLSGLLEEGRKVHAKFKCTKAIKVEKAICEGEVICAFDRNIENVETLRKLLLPLMPSPFLEKNNSMRIDQAAKALVPRPSP